MKYTHFINVYSLCVLLCLLSDMAAVFQSFYVIMRPQESENSDRLTWREKNIWRQRVGGVGWMLLFSSSNAELKKASRKLPLLTYIIVNKETCFLLQQT